MVQTKINLNVQTRSKAKGNPEEFHSSVQTRVKGDPQESQKVKDSKGEIKKLIYYTDKFLRNQSMNPQKFFFPL